MSTKAQQLIETLHDIDGKAEIVDGEIVVMSPSGKWPGRAAGFIFRSLLAYEEQNKAGFAVGDNVGFAIDLPGRESFSPDAAWVPGDPGDPGDEDALDFIQGAPAFAVEVRSKNDYGKRKERKIAEKIADYFEAGALAVWDVDLKSAEPIRLHLAHDPTHPLAFRRGETAHAEPVLPGWSFPVDNLFS